MPDLTDLLLYLASDAGKPQWLIDEELELEMMEAASPVPSEYW